ncbi:MAG: SpoIIE family protein phosphatase [Melioribacteraceae bacterium]|nr:SpoIIE family protein phosphatase [Melioribacteraceae bacterium]
MLSINNNAALRNLSALVDFSNLINSNLELDIILNNLLLTCFGKFHTTRGIVALVDNDGFLKVMAYKGLTCETIKKFPECQLENARSNEDMIHFIDSSRLFLSVNIEVSGSKIGLLFLGRRLSNENYTKEDKDFLNTLLNIASSAIQNSLIVEKLKMVNRDLDSKVNQLSSLFDLSKEFSSIIDSGRVNKLLVYSIIGQLLVTKFAIVSCTPEGINILENRFSKLGLEKYIKNCEEENFTGPVCGKDVDKNFTGLFELGVELIVPMQIKSRTKGLILLGKKTGGSQYSKSDIEYVSALGSLAVISIENARLFSEALEKQRLEKDLEIAQNIQRNLLPDKIPAMKSFDISAVNYSARQVGGDYYDIVKLSDTRTLVAIADVSGKGVQAALLMANLQAFLQSIAKQNIAINEASNLLNDLVSENTTDGSFITFFWGILDDESKEFTFVNMGHNPPIHIRDHKITKLKLGGMILGVMPTVAPYKYETIKLESKDKIIMFTDGITEAMNVEGKEYSDERLEELCVEMENESSSEIMDKIITDVRNYTNGAQQSDDITALVIKVN